MEENGQAPAGAKAEIGSQEFRDALAKCRADHGDAAALWTPLGGIVCRPPTSEVYNRAADSQYSVNASIAVQEARGSAGKGTRQLPTSVKRVYVNDCIVYPSIQAATPIFDRYPGAVGKLAGELDKLAGEELEVISGN